MEALERHFAFQHENPPAPFNPSYNPKSQEWSDKASKKMLSQGFYDNHTLEECAKEYRRLYDKFKARFEKKSN